MLWWSWRWIVRPFRSLVSFTTHKQTDTHTRTHTCTQRNWVMSCVSVSTRYTHTHTHTDACVVDEFCFNSASWLQFLIKIVYARKRSGSSVSARYSICICICCTTKASSLLLLLLLWFGESRVADCNYCNRVSNRSNPMRSLAGVRDLARFRSSSHTDLISF